MTILATYGTTSVCRSITPGKPSFAAVCSACVETIKVGKQHARIASAARAHAADAHGFKFEWTEDVEEGVWYIQGADGTFCNVWPSASGDWFWLFGRCGDARSARIAGDRAASKVSAQIQGTLAAADYFKSRAR